MGALAILVLLASLAAVPASAEEVLATFKLPRKHPDLPDWTDVEELSVVKVPLLGVTVSALRLKFYGPLPKGEVVLSINVYIDKDRNPETGYRGSDTRLYIAGVTPALRASAYYWNSTRRLWSGMRGVQLITMMTGDDTIMATLPPEVLGPEEELKSALVRLDVTLMVSGSFSFKP